MNGLERAAQAVAIRPMIWNQLSKYQARVLHCRINGQAYTAIAETMPGGAALGWTPDEVKKLEQGTIERVLRLEKLSIAMSRDLKLMELA